MKNYKTSVKISSIIMFILYLSYLIYLTFFDHTYGRDVFQRRLIIVPFKTILKFLTSSYNWKVVMINIAGNIAAFVPMGFLPPLAFDRLKSFSRVLIVVFLATLSIEVCQYIFAVGTSDIDDIILNVLGGILGYFMMWISVRLVSLIYEKSNKSKSI
jgi:glycopeptide antibiotics resistance protein